MFVRETFLRFYLLLFHSFKTIWNLFWLSNTGFLKQYLNWKRDQTSGVNSIIGLKTAPPTPYIEGKERLKKESDLSRLVGGQCSKQGNYMQVLSWVATRPGDLTCLHRSLTWVQSCVQSRWSPQHIAFPGLHLWNCSHCGNSGQDVHSKDSGGVRSFWLPGSCLRINPCHILSTSSNRCISDVS